jgi:hypothetical protein
LTIKKLTLRLTGYWLCAHSDVETRIVVIYQRRTKKGMGWLTKTVLQRETVKTQRVEMACTISAIDNEVRFFFIFLNSLLV